MPMATDDDPHGYSLVTPFLTGGMTDAEDHAFVLGYEFCRMVTAINSRKRRRDVRFEFTVHRANEERIRLACNRAGRRCNFSRIDDNWMIFYLDPDW
jgi:hypothetical protein